MLFTENNNSFSFVILVRHKGDLFSHLCDVHSLFTHPYWASCVAATVAAAWQIFSLFSRASLIMVIVLWRVDQRPEDREQLLRDANSECTIICREISTIQYSYTQIQICCNNMFGWFNKMYLYFFKK